MPFFAKSQHCPYDAAVVIFVKNKNSKTKSSIKLIEVNYEQDCKCKFNPAPYNLDFKPAKDVLEKNYGKYLASKNKDTLLFNNRYYAVILGQSTVDCMIENAATNDYSYKKRVYEIQYYKNGKLQKLSIDDQYKFELCSLKGSWKRFKAIEIDAD